MKYKDFKMLSKDDMKTVKGGSEGAGTSQCYFHTTGSAGEQSFSMFFAASCPAVSTQANDYCVTQIITAGTGVSHCSYNCGCSA